MNEPKVPVGQNDFIRNCPGCGKSIEDDSPGEYCVLCMLKLAASETDPFDAAEEEKTGRKEQKDEDTCDNGPDFEEIRRAFPQFEISGLIGKGGMGSVYKARQAKLNRYVALKILSSKIPHQGRFAERFLREAQILAKLNHPNIVTVHDFGESAGLYYLVLEYVEGVNLRQAMREKRFTPQQAISIIPKICEALQYAHEEGVLHRDIKPENILLKPGGHIKIADFGIGKLVREKQGSSDRDKASQATHLTKTGVVLGTPNYMAPEQLESPEEVDHRADIYSLGVVFYEMLTGEIPRGIFPLPSEKTPVDSEIDHIVLKALKRDREQRQQSAAQLKTEIETSVTSEKQANVAQAGPFPENKNDDSSQKKKRSSSFPKGKTILLPVFQLIALVLIFFIITGGIKPMPGPDLLPVFVIGGAYLTAIVIVALLVGGIALIVFAAQRRNSGPPDSGAADPETLFCTHCGNKLDGSIYACPKCGFAPRSKREYCYHCGAKTDPEQVMCVQCRSSLALPNPIPFWGGKQDRIAAALFAILLGWLGIHKFYLGSWGWGVIYILFMWSSIPLIIGVIEGIVFLVMDDRSFDIRYNQTRPHAFRW